MLNQPDVLVLVLLLGYAEKNESKENQNPPTERGFKTPSANKLNP